MKRAALALLLVSSTALAKSSAELPWALPEVFGVAVRFVRVDRNCKISDRDEASAYVLFECPGDEGKPPRRGALELYRATARDGRAVVRAQVTLTDEPRWVELRFLELLERKLRDERGVPPPPPPPARERPASPPADGGIITP